MSLLNCFRRAARPGLCVLAAASLAACGPSSKTPAAAPTAAADPAGPRFLTPPTLAAARREADGAVTLTGHAAPGAVVTLRNPDGETLSGAASSEGDWSIRAPANTTPRLYALSGAGPSGVLKGEGAVLTAPASATPGLLLRAGAPSLTLAAPDGSLQLQAVDFDPGGLGVAGLADPSANLRLSVDGRPAAAGQADDKGRFTLLAVQADLKPGGHRLTLEDGTRVVEAAVTTTAGALGAAPYQVATIPGGWRIDWSIPGGGVQSSLVFSPALKAER